MVEESCGINHLLSFGSQLVAQSKFQKQFFSFIVTRFGVVAQLVEHLLCKQGVAGSNPAGSTNSRSKPN